MAFVRLLSLIAISLQGFHFVLVQSFNYNYFYEPPTYTNPDKDYTQWPCGNYGATTTNVSLSEFYILLYNRHNNTNMSFLMSRGNDTLDFDIVLGQPLHMSKTGYISWFFSLEDVAEDGQIKTVQMISSGEDFLTYICVEVKLNASLFATDKSDQIHNNITESIAEGFRDSTNTATIVTDGTLANGSTPRAGTITVPARDLASLNESAASVIDLQTSATDTSSTTSPSSTSSPSALSSASLSTGAKIGIGVAIPLAVIIVAILAFIFLRRRRKAEQAYGSSALTPNTLTSNEKSELHGSAYDPAIAGVVKPKPELAITEQSKYEADSKLHPSATHGELPVPSAPSANAPWSHSKDGYLPPELGRESKAHPSAVKDGSVGEGGTVSSGTTDVSPSGITAAATSTPHEAEHDDVSASEADFLVQELGLVTMRKKALVSAATSQGIKPEDAPGTRGEDYRELVEREARLRGRIEDIDRRRGGV